MTDSRVHFMRYAEAASNLAEALRNAADALDRGEMPPLGAGERIGRIMSQLEGLGCDLRTYLELLGADISDVHTVEGLNRAYHKAAIEQLLTSLDGIQEIEASDKKFAEPMQELQKQSATVAQNLRGSEDFPSEESMRTASQAEAVLGVFDSAETERADSINESAFENLGISDTIVLGLMLGKYRRTQPTSDAERQTAARDAAQKETEMPETSALESDQGSGTENQDEFESKSDGAGDGGRMIRSLGKLRDRKPSARRFLHELQSIGGPLAKIAVQAVYFNDVVTANQIAVSIQAEADFPIPQQTEEDLRETLKRLVQHGILGAYRQDDEILYVFTRFGLESMKKRDVQRVVQLTHQRPENQLEIVAAEEMRASLLITRWMWNEMHTRVDDWLRRETGRSLPGNWDGDRVIGDRYAIKLPRGYGDEDKIYLVKPYELPRTPEDYPVLYVVVTTDVSPLEADIEEQEGSLLLFEGTLYKRQNGEWVRMQRTAHSEQMPSKQATKKHKKRKH